MEVTVSFYPVCRVCVFCGELFESRGPHNRFCGKHSKYEKQCFRNSEISALLAKDSEFVEGLDLEAFGVPDLVMLNGERIERHRNNMRRWRRVHLKWGR